jgi:predicted CopG family antitoxin
MTETHWHIRLTLDSSTKEGVIEDAKKERRSVSNYIRILLEREQNEKAIFRAQNQMRIEELKIKRDLIEKKFSENTAGSSA